MSNVVKLIKSLAEKTILDRRLKRRFRTAFHFSQNILGFAFHFPTARKSQKIFAQIKSGLDNIADASNSQRTGEIPKIIHFVYGFKQSEELPYYAYLAVLSALHYNLGWRAVFHFHKEPNGVYWNKLKPQLLLNQIDDFSYFGIARIHHYAHKADIIRLLALQRIGGVYLDIDTLTAKSFEPLLEFEFVMGIQANVHDKKGGLCNAVILSKPWSKFLNRWISKYKTFHSKGRDQLWDFHSVKLPAQLSYSNPGEIKVLDHDAFFYPLWLDVERILLDENSMKWQKFLKGSFVFHLWNGFTENRINAIDEAYILNSKSIYAEICRLVLGLKV